VSETADDLVLRGWAVDPGSGREGPAEVVVRDGVLEQVTNGVAVRMAMLYLLAGAQHAGGHP
jgi:hypothetical protein